MSSSVAAPLTIPPQLITTHAADRDYCTRCGQQEVSKLTECIPFIWNIEQKEASTDNSEPVTFGKIPNPFEQGPAIA